MSSPTRQQRSATDHKIENDHCSRHILIVNADDFGKDESITKDIAQCVDRGVVTSASIMPNMPAAGSALKEAKLRRDHASFGVHLTLCEGPSLTNAATLTGNSGKFSRRGSLGLRVLLGSVDMEELRSELRAQISLVQDYGIPVSHLDSHKHLHHLPLVASAVGELAVEFGISRIRCAQTLLSTSPLVSIRSYAFQLARNLFARRARQRFVEGRLTSPDHCLDLSVLLSSTTNTLEEILCRSGRSTELICHLGDSTRNGGTGAEMQFLLSSSLSSLLERTGCELATYWDI
jgi:predicted glycoside hydrolase/deacetylase ChbG (UPF0249 family)